MNITLYKESRFNCFHINIAAILSRLGYNTRYLFSQCGLFYLAGEGGESEQLSSVYRKFESHMDELYGVKFINRIVTGAEECIVAVKQSLCEGRTVVVESNCYFLPFCPLYNETYIPHSLEVVGYSAEGFEVADHYWQYSGYMGETEFAAMLERSLEHKAVRELYLWHLDNSNSDASLSQGRHDQAIYPIIDNNYRLMSGQALYDCGPHTCIGVNAFTPIVAHLLRIKSIPEPERQLRRVKFFTDAFKEIAHSRYHYSLFLDLAGIKRLSEQYAEADQCWTVVTNLLIKAAGTRQFAEYEQRILQRMDRVIQSETQGLALTGELLKERWPT